MGNCIIDEMAIEEGHEEHVFLIFDRFAPGGGTVLMTYPALILISISMTQEESSILLVHHIVRFALGRTRL